jgi:hypothetical protein
MEDLRRLEGLGLLKVSPPLIGLNFVHTLNNRLGLSITDELILVDLLRRD